jgi:hypothetical protein
MTGRDFENFEDEEYCISCAADHNDEIAMLRARIAELEMEVYNLQHSITQAIDPRRTDAARESRT